MSFVVATSEITTLWQQLKASDTNDHHVFELWVLLKNPSSHRPPMEVRGGMVFTLQWVNDILRKTRHGSRLGFLATLRNRCEKELDGGADPDKEVESLAVKVKPELIKNLEVALEYLRAQVVGGDTKKVSEPEAEAAAEKLRVAAAAKLASTRSKQRENVWITTEGLLWHTTAAADGKPYTVLTNSLNARPPQALIKLGAAAEATGAKQPSPPKTLSARWRREGDVLWLEVLHGDAQLVREITLSLGVVARVGGAGAALAGSGEKAATDLVRLSLIHAVGRKGYFWFFKAIPGHTGPLVVTRATKDKDLELLASEFAVMRGKWGRDLLAKRVTYTFTDAADPASGKALALLLRARGGHRQERVEIVAGGVHQLDPRFSDKPKVTAGGAKGWFCYVRADRTKRTAASVTVVDKKDEALVARMGKAGGFEGTWRREKVGRCVTFTLKGAIGDAEGRQLASHLRKLPAYKDERVEIVGAGLLLVDPRFPESVVDQGDLAEKKVISAHAGKVKGIYTENCRLARAPSGRYWFTTRDAAGELLIVLYSGPTPSFDKRALLKKDAAPNSHTEGTWTRDVKKREIVLTAKSGSAGLLARMREHLKTAKVWAESRFSVDE